MGARCDICLEETCGGLKNCDCEICGQKDECPRVLRPTIRITMQCTQACHHCCFSCSPKETKMMSIQTAKDINEFLINNQIETANIMGGEFFCNPDWEEIIYNLIKNLKSARLVSNGDWADSMYYSLVVDFLVRNPKIHLSLSCDRWHTNKNIDKAIELCNQFDIDYNVAEPNEVTEESIVPIGNSQWDFNFYSMFGCYCTKPDRKYHFLIDEDGEIYKCTFGIWNYADIYNYKDDFKERFKEFHGVFYNSFLGNCANCIRGHQNSLREKERII